MTCIGNKFASLRFSNKFPPTYIANGCSFLVVDDEVVRAVTLLTHNVPKFPVV